MTDAVERVPRQAWFVMAAAIGAYFLAVVHRTALGVAGVEAFDRFDIQATGLAMLSVAQIATYAALQLPAGALLDRFGAKRVIVIGSLVMAVGQLMLALADSYPTAIAARILLGAGDAPIFIAACRLVAHWFPPRRAPLMVQVTGFVGQTGQLATAIPVAWLLAAYGWTVAFVALAIAGVVIAVVAAVGVREPRPGAVGQDDVVVAEGPGSEAAVAAPERERFASQVRLAMSPAGTRLGFWTHFTSLFSANTLALLWGVPFFITAQELTRAEASALLTVLTIAKMVAGPIAGSYTARHPLRRSWMVLGSAVATAIAWVVLLVPSTPRPMWELVIFMGVVGAGGPVSLIGMDYARTFAPRAQLGTATGFVNMGGFVSTIASVLLVGLVLQVASPAGSSVYSLDEYRIAFAALLVPWLVGVSGVLRNRRRTRLEMAEAGVIVPPLREVLRRRRER
ncbi:MFS transporter [Demequina zhanjiangensis]|uniref:MFS transporter n=1 Tax=Demequina zhanjiangensis TaxID=3051659 RepID=A0ABT8FZM0_9MICO|nr:MFS transporter [Demequina sp. SYSU T00b26]MDN4471919.1 MFS transporter [Demequina sp. SYSU T00b26]